MPTPSARAARSGVLTLSFVLLLAFLQVAEAVAAAPCPEPGAALADPVGKKHRKRKQQDQPCSGIGCVDEVIAEMDRRFQALASGCDHDAVFALVYLRTTEEFKRAVEEPGFFVDTDYLRRQDVLFADYYFRAYDAWAAGASGDVPEAWRIAFDAARGRTVSGTGDILLGMNAHINRDLPFVLAEMGLAFPDGSTRKPDHDRVNDFLWRVIRPALDEAATRFDPSIDDANLPGTTLDEQVLFQLVVAWREGAWQNAVRLAQAQTEAERAFVAASIEAGAALVAQALRLQNAYLPPLTTTAHRDAWCADHWDEAGYGDPTSTDLIDLGGLLSGILSPVFPNPFNPQATFTVAVEETQHVRVEVFDLLGRRVALLHDGPLAAGTPHSFTFDAGHLPTGRYLLRAHGDHFTRQQMMTLMK